jgi:methionyl aminopeptidase
MPRPSISSQADADAAEAAAHCVVKTHQRLAEWLRVGMKLPQIDQFVAATLEELGCRSCFLHYRVGRSNPFPSYACLSVNDCVVHGTAGYYPHPMKPGDVLKIDVGVFHRGWVGDAAWTYVFKEMSPEVKRLTDCGKLALKEGVEQFRPGNTYLAWAQTVQHIVEDSPERGGFGFHLVRGLGGHGYGRKLHAPPFISNIVPNHHYEWPDSTLECEPGTLLAVEPMIAVGTSSTTSRPKEWPVYIADGSLSVHYEHDVLITADGPRVLTRDLEALPDIVG